MPRALGLDLGTKTIGVALSDELELTAQGLPTIHRRGQRKDIEALIELATAREVELFVLGLPFNLDGTEGPRAKATRDFAALLAERSGLGVEFQDERFTTMEAQRTLLSADVSRQKRKEVVDQLAATLILQTWLDRRRNRPPNETEDDRDEEDT